MRRIRPSFNKFRMRGYTPTEWISRIFTYPIRKGERIMLSQLLRRRGRRETDPVCAMQVDSDKPPGGSYEYQGQTYYFCGPGCNRAFQKEPDAYLSGEKKIRM